MSDLIRVSHGLWRPPAAVDDLYGWAAAMLTVCPPHAVICGQLAALLHGLWLPSQLSRRFEVIVHPDIPLATARGRNRRRDIRARRQVLLPDEVVVLDGIPVTSEARTWLDLAPVLSIADLVATGDSAVRGSATPDELAELISRATHRRGVVRARSALPLLDARSRSRPESHLRYALVSSGLPAPAVNEPIFDAHGGWLAEPDLSYEDVRLAIEYNGRDHADERRMRKDITREVDISIAGWRTETFGPAEVFRRPDQIVSLIRQLRRERRPPLNGPKSRDWSRISGHSGGFGPLS